MPSYRQSNWSGRSAGSKHAVKAGQVRALLQRLPKMIAHEVAKRAAPELTGLARTAYSSGQSVYGEARKRGVNGNALTLRRTGATERTVRFVSTGTIVRCALGTKWSRYLVGKYGILPNGAMPAHWIKKLDEVVAEVSV